MGLSYMRACWIRSDLHDVWNVESISNLNLIHEAKRTSWSATR